MQVVKTWNYTGGVQSWQVPTYVTSVFMELWGAPGMQGTYASAAGSTGFSGATGAYAYGGHYDSFNVADSPDQVGSGEQGWRSLVGYVSGTLAVTAADTYSLYVGGGGGVTNNNVGNTTNYGPGGYNGGANGGYAQVTPYSYGGGGGGGATDVRHSGTALANRILVAGGGGGGSSNGGNLVFNTTAANPTSPSPYSNSTVPGHNDNAGPNYRWVSGNGYGGSGGTTTGQTGGLASSASVNSRAGSGGSGGTQSAGGVGGTAVAFSRSGAAGTLGNGGLGAPVTTSDSNTNQVVCAGGGGGGGYYGGGGGSSGLWNNASTQGATGGGGGGGSNFVSGSFTTTTSLAHIIPGGLIGSGANGFARFTYIQPPNPPAISSPSAGAYVNAGSTLSVLWSFSSLAAGASQGGYDIEYSVHNAGSWTLASFPTGHTTGSHTFAANTFTAGTSYDIQVRVYDTGGDVSAWQLITIFAITIPSAPTITAPTTNANTTTPFNVTWTVDAGAVETMYRVQGIDANGVVQVDSGELYSSRMNFSTNPSFENNTTDWTATGSATIATSVTFAKIGTHSLKITWPTTSAFVADARHAFTTVPGQAYTVSYWYTVGNVATDPFLTPAVLSSAGSIIATGNTVSVAVAGTFVQGSIQFTAVDGTSTLVLANNAPVTAGAATYVDAVLVEMGTTLNSYFDGTTANGNPGTQAWVGTAGNSISKLVIANVLTYAMTWPTTSQKITVSVKYGDVADLGVYSAAGQVTPIVNVNPPGTPTVVLTPSPDTGSISLAITNSGAGVNTTVSNDVYRTDVTDGQAEIRIATGLVPNSTYTDYTAATQTVYAYRVRAYSATGGFADAT